MLSFVLVGEITNFAKLRKFSNYFTMDSSLYDHKLAGHRIFKDLKGNLNENPSGKLCNLLELKDDVLFIWNPVENCLWCLNLKQLEEHGDDTSYQVPLLQFFMYFYGLNDCRHVLLL